MSQGSTELESQSIEGAIQGDLRCRGCGYNLRGLTLDQACPQCQKSIAASLSVQQRELSGKLAGLTLKQQVFFLAIWPFMEQMLNFLVGFVDTYLAGHLSVEATNAIAPASYVQWLVYILQMSVGIGAAAVIARAVGSKHKRLANAALGQAIVLSVIFGLCSAVLVYSLAPGITSLMNLDEPSYSYSVSYLRIMALAAPMSSVLFVGAACLRAAGDTRTPFIVLAVVNVINAIVSWTLVEMDYGVAGIATGTAIAWVVGAVLIMVVLIGGWGGIRLRLMRLRPRWHTMRRIIRVASSSLAESTGMWVGNFLVLIIVGWVGITESAALGAHLIAIRLEAISYLPCMALGIAAATLTGQYLGLGDPQRAKQAGRLCWLYGAIVMGVMGVLFLVVPHWMVGLVTDKEPLLELAPDLLRICGPVQIFFATAIVLLNAMRGAGDTRTTMILTYFSVFVIRLPLAYVLAIELDYGLKGLWFGLCAELVFRGLIFAARYLHGGWAKVKV